ncbi:MAG: alpha/beta hydrolase [Actinomycetota bacterium]|nr:alpha/beta hydrolase [Actinomycetota bacterium]
MKIIVRSMLSLVSLAGVAFLGLFGFGARLRREGQKPIDDDSLRADNGRTATTADGRTVEYFTYGSSDPASEVVVNMHGSGLEGRFEKVLHAPICESLGVRGIAISLPACGNTDMKPGRRVIDWATEDLAAVLDAESVDTFMITGHSQGNPHAMAAAVAYPDRVVGIGFNAPLLPASIVQAEGLPPTVGQNELPDTERLRSPLMAWYFGVYHLAVDTFAPRLPLRAIAEGKPNVEQDTEVLARFASSVRRSITRGTAGGAWESARDVCFDWGLDPRDIQCRNVVVWHARDDTLCPPEQGKWLAGLFAAREGTTVQFRDDDEGYSHLTYTRGPYATPDGSMVKALLSGLG